MTLKGRTKDIFDKTENQIANGVDVYEYIPIIYKLIKKEDYEAAEGIKLAISNLGLKLVIPKTDDELNKCLEFLKKKRKANE